jgi:hypothetical protein
MWKRKCKGAIRIEFACDVLIRVIQLDVNDGAGHWGRTTARELTRDFFAVIARLVKTGPGGRVTRMGLRSNSRNGSKQT